MHANLTQFISNPSFCRLKIFKFCPIHEVIKRIKIKIILLLIKLKIDRLNKARINTFKVSKYNTQKRKKKSHLFRSMHEKLEKKVTN